jgi:hypothetical protein
MVAEKLGRPEDIGALMVHVQDPDPHLRAIASSALSGVIALDRGASPARAAFQASLQDPGRSVPLAIAHTLNEMDRRHPAAEAALERLREHPSAEVRNAARF